MMDEEKSIETLKAIDKGIKEAINNLLDELAKIFGGIDRKELRKYQRRVAYHKRLSQRNNEQRKKRK